LSPAITGQKIILLYGEDASLLERVREVFSDYEVINPTTMLESFDFIKDNFVEAILFSTFQTEPFTGVNSTDLDVLLYYASSEDSQNKHMVFLPIDPFDTTLENTNKAQVYYEELYSKYVFLLSPVTKETLEEDSIKLSQTMQELSSIVTLLDNAVLDLDERVLSHKESEEIESDDVTVVKGDYFKGDEEISRIAGLNEEEESVTVLSGSKDEDKFSQVVKGNAQEEEKFSQTISGEKEDLKEEAITIKGQKEVIKEENYLIKGGAQEAEDFTKDPQSINSRNAHGMTPVMVLARMGKIDKVKKLLESGADPNLLSYQGKSLLHYACRGTNDLSLIEDLVESYNLKVNKRDNKGHDPLFEATIGDNAALIDFLVYSGARLEAKYEGEGLLHLAIKNNAFKSFQQLLISGANLKSRNRLGEDVVTFCKKKRLLKPLRIIADFTKKKKEAA